MLSCGEFPEVLSSLRDDIVVKLEKEFSGLLSIDMDVHLGNSNEYGWLKLHAFHLRRHASWKFM